MRQPSWFIYEETWLNTIISDCLSCMPVLELQIITSSYEVSNKNAMMFAVSVNVGYRIIYQWVSQLSRCSVTPDTVRVVEKDQLMYPVHLGLSTAIIFSIHDQSTIWNIDPSKLHFIVMVS